MIELVGKSASTVCAGSAIAPADRLWRAARCVVDRLEARTLLAAVTSIDFDVDSPTHDVGVTFDAPVDPAAVAASDLIVRRVGSDGRVGPAGVTVTLGGGDTRATFSHAARLAPGDYVAQFLAGDLVTAGGAVFKTDASLGFFYKPGDATGPQGVRDRIADDRDRALVTANLGTTAPSFSKGDFDYDGAVTQADYDEVDSATLPEPITAVSGFTARAVGPDVELGWRGESAVSSDYHIERSADGGRTYTVVAASLGPAVEEYLDATANLSGTGSYRYRIRSTEPLNILTGVRRPSRYVEVTINYGRRGDGPSPIQPPLGLTVASVTKNTATLAWIDASTGEDGVEVWRSTDGGATFARRKTLAQPDATGWTDEDLQAGTGYAYKVRAFDATTSAFGNVAASLNLTGPPSVVGPGGVETSLPQYLVATFDQPVFPAGGPLSNLDVAVYAPGQSRALVGAGTDPEFTVAGIAGNRLRVLLRDRIADGNYELTVRGDAVRNAAGQTIADAGAPDREGIAEAFFFAGDFNGDRIINFPDLVVLAQHYNQSNRTYAQGDANFDGTVGFADLVILAQRYGATYAAPPRGVNALQASTGALADPNFDPQHTATPSNAAYVEWTAPDPAEAPFDGYGVWRSVDGVNFGDPIAQVPVTQLNFIDRGLQEGTRYTYRVRPYRTTGGYGETTNRASVVTTMSGPTNVAARPTADGTLHVTWTDRASGESRYEIEIFDSEGELVRAVRDVPANATAWAVSGLDEGTTYTVHVLAATASGVGRAALGATARTRLATPTDVEISDVTDTAATVSWTDQSDHEAGYTIRWLAAQDLSIDGDDYAEGDVIGSTFVEAVAARGAPQSATLTDLPDGANLFFDVTAEAGEGEDEIASGSGQSAPTRGGVATGRPVQRVSASSIMYGDLAQQDPDEFHRAADQIRIDWSDNQRNVAHYYVWAETPKRALLAIVPAAGRSRGRLSYTATGLDPNQSYTFSVQPEVTNNPPIAAAKSQAVSTGLQAAGHGVGFWVEEVDGHSATLRWNPIEGAASFRLYRQETGQTDPVSVGELGGSADERKVSGLKGETSYLFTLRIIYHGDRYVDRYVGVVTPEDTASEASERAEDEAYVDYLESLTPEGRQSLVSYGGNLLSESNGGLGWYRRSHQHANSSPHNRIGWESYTYTTRLRYVSEYGERVFNVEQTTEDWVPDELPETMPDLVENQFDFYLVPNINDPSVPPYAVYSLKAPAGTKPTDSWSGEIDGSIVNDDGTLTSNHRQPWGVVDQVLPGTTIRFAQQSRRDTPGTYPPEWGVAPWGVTHTYTAPTYTLDPADRFGSESDAEGDDHADEEAGSENDESNDEDRSPRPGSVRVLSSTATSNLLALRDNSTNEEGIEIERSRDGRHWALIASIGGDRGGLRSAADSRDVTFADGGLAAGVEYQYRARAFKWTETGQTLDGGGVLHALEFTRWSAKAEGLTDAEIGVWAETPTVTEGQAEPGQFGVYRIGEAEDPITAAMQIAAGPGDASYLADYLIDQPATQPQNGATVDFDFDADESLTYIDVDVSMTDATAEGDEPIELIVANDDSADPAYEPAGRATILIAEIADLDIDTDNRDGLSVPSNAGSEDAIEDAAGGVGKIVHVADGDVDEDGIPDFADTFDWDRGYPEATLGGSQLRPAMVPLALRLRETDGLLFSLAYDGSDPDGVTYTGAGDSLVYAAAAGTARVWTSDGNFVSPQTLYDATDLGVDNGVAHLWLEALTPSASAGGLRVALMMTSGPAPSFEVDAIRSTAFKTRFATVDANDSIAPATSLAASRPAPTFAGASITYSNVRVSPDKTRVLADLAVSGSVTDSWADSMTQGENGLSSVAVHLNGESEAAYSVNLTAQNQYGQKLLDRNKRRYQFARTFASVPISPGWNTVRLSAADVMGGLGTAERSFDVSVALPESQTVTIRYEVLGDSTVPSSQVIRLTWQGSIYDTAPSILELSRVGESDVWTSEEPGTGNILRAVMTTALSPAGVPDLTQPAVLTLPDAGLSGVTLVPSNPTAAVRVAAVPAAIDPFKLSDFRNASVGLSEQTPLDVSDEGTFTPYVLELLGPSDDAFLDMIQLRAEFAGQEARQFMLHQGHLLLGSDGIPSVLTMSNLDSAAAPNWTAPDVDSESLTDGFLEGVVSTFEAMYDDGKAIVKIINKGLERIQDPEVQGQLARGVMAVVSPAYGLKLVGQELRDADFGVVKSALKTTFDGAVKFVDVSAKVIDEAPGVFEDVLTGNDPDWDSLSEETRVVASFALEAYDAIREASAGLSRYDAGWWAGRITGEITVQVAGALLTAGAANAATALTKVVALQRLLARLGPAAGPVANRLKAILPPLIEAFETTTMCFVAGTLVHTSSGLVPIEAVRVGDLVLSRDAVTGEQTFKPVVDTIETHPDELYELTYGIDLNGDGSLDRFDHVTTTGAHPFYVQGENAFVNASDLKIDDNFRLADGRAATLVDVEIEAAVGEATFTTYNFEVADFHTYFVGDDGVWVHNSSSASCERLFSLFDRFLKRSDGDVWAAHHAAMTRFDGLAAGDPRLAQGGVARVQMLTEARRRYFDDPTNGVTPPPWLSLSAQTLTLSNPPAPTGQMAQQLAGNMLAAYRTARPEGFATHHLIPPKLDFDGLGVQLRTLLTNHGVHLNEAANGVYLPKFISVAQEFPSLGTPHSQIHSRAYLQALWNRLSAIPSGSPTGLRNELQKIAGEVAEGTFPH